MKKVTALKKVAPELKEVYRIIVKKQPKPGVQAEVFVINDPCRPNIEGNPYGLRPAANSRGYAWANLKNAEKHLAEIQKVYPKAKLETIKKTAYESDRHRGPKAKKVEMLPGEVFGTAQNTAGFGF